MSKSHLNFTFQIFSFIFVFIFIFTNLHICSCKISVISKNGTKANYSYLNSTSANTLKILEKDLNYSNPVVLQNSNLSHDPDSKDSHFGFRSLIFEEYLKNVDLSILPGSQKNDDFENWRPPEEVPRELPTYVAGFDYKNRPILVVEYGRYNFTRYANGNKSTAALFHKYFRYLTYILLKSHAIKNTAEHPVNHHVVLVDFQGLGQEQLLNPRALQLQFKLIKDYRHLTKKYAAKLIFLNVNPLAELLFSACRSFLLSFADKIEIYDTNKAVWGPKLLKSFPKDQIPEWYGGSKGFKPVFINR